MNALKVVGIQRISYDRKDGSHAEGVNFHLADLNPGPDCTGMTVMSAYLSAFSVGRLSYVPQLNDMVYPLRSDRGYVVDFLPGGAPSGGAPAANHK